MYYKKVNAEVVRTQIGTKLFQVLLVQCWMCHFQKLDYLTCLFIILSILS